MSVKAMSWVWELELPASQKLVMLALADRATDDGKCWPGLEEVSTKSGMTKRNLIRVLNTLEQGGYLTRIKRYADNGHRSSNVYQLNIGESDLPKAGQVIAKAKRLSDNMSPRLSDKKAQLNDKLSPRLSDTHVTNIRTVNNTSTNVEEAEASHTPPNFSWTVGVELLTGAGMKEKPARALLGKLIKTYGEPAVEDALLATQAKEPVERVAYLHAVLKEQAARAKAKPRVAVGDDWLERLL